MFPRLGTLDSSIEFKYIIILTNKTQTMLSFLKIILIYDIWIQLCYISFGSQSSSWGLWFQSRGRSSWYDSYEGEFVFFVFDFIWSLDPYEKGACFLVYKQNFEQQS